MVLMYRWSRSDPNARIHNMEVLQATKRLHDTVIPSLASELDKLFDPHAKNLGMLDVNFSYELHRRGGTNDFVLCR